MDFKKPLSQEQYGKERLYRHHRTNFVAGSILILFFLFSQFSFCGTEKEPPTPTQKDIQYASNLTTVEGRTFSIGKTYADAKIIAERTLNGEIISVYEVGNQYSFAVFEPLKDGYWQEYQGELFSKTDLVRGTVPIGEDDRLYDIYLLGTDDYTSLQVTRENSTYPRNVQQETISFNDAGIAVMGLREDIHDPYPRIIAYDTKGNETLLATGKIPLK